MTILENIKKRAMEAMKAKDAVASSILRLAASEVQMVETRSGNPVTDDEAAGVLRKLIKSNEETLRATNGAEEKATLERENELLSSFLPKGLSVDEIAAALAPVADAIRGAAADGPATGIAMKHLKQSGISAQGADVTKAVAKLRA
ncbi:MAG: GatB/YqeY domain-containing protein [Polyangiaceae bacterium]